MTTPPSSKGAVPKRREEPEEPEQGLRSRSESAYERVRSAILTGELEPGEGYSQVALADKLDVSRTPLREAIRRLQAEDLLRSERGQRILVAPLDATDLGQLHAMRISQESLGVRLSVPHLTDADLRAARAALDEHVAATNRGDVIAATEPHREFHQILFSHAGTRLVKALTELWDHADRYRRLFYSRDKTEQLAMLQLASADHEAIYAAAADRQADLSSELIATHIARSILTLSARHIDDPEPPDVRVALRHVIEGAASRFDD